MSIWKSPFTVDMANEMNAGCAVSHLGITITEIGDDYMKATMPVDERTRQPVGLLHGGASVLLAESLGSTAAYMASAPNSRCVGLEVNANHLRSVTRGQVIATARPVHLGKTTQVWNIEIHNELNQLVCVSRLTMAILKAPDAD